MTVQQQKSRQVTPSTEMLPAASEYGINMSGDNINQIFCH